MSLNTATPDKMGSDKMSADKSPRLGAPLEEKDVGGNISEGSTLDTASSLDRQQDLLAQQDLDPVLSRKMNLVNNVR